MILEKLIKVENLNIDKLAKEIKKGKIVVFPTSTIYGIGTNAFDKEAVKRIFEIKKRDKNKSLIVLISNYNMLDKIANPLNDIEKKLVEKFWPGSLTLILDKKEIVLNEVTAFKNTVAVRYDSCQLVNKIIDKAQVPIVAPSANISNEKYITDIKDLSNKLFDSVDYVIDAGKLQSDKESTIVRVEDNSVIILRLGKISKENIQDALIGYNVNIIES